jgi:hypothetical protein
MGNRRRTILLKIVSTTPRFQVRFLRILSVEIGGFGAFQLHPLPLAFMDKLLI